MHEEEICSIQKTLIEFHIKESVFDLDTCHIKKSHGVAQYQVINQLGLGKVSLAQT